MKYYEGINEILLSQGVHERVFDGNYFTPLFVQAHLAQNLLN